MHRVGVERRQQLWISLFSFGAIDKAKLINRRLRMTLERGQG